MLRIIVLLLLLSLHGWAQPFRLRDDASQDPSLLKFRQELRVIVARQDWKALLPLLDPQICYSYGLDKPGPAGFQAFWTYPDRNLWRELNHVLSGGGILSDPQHFWAPCTYMGWPKDKDELMWAVVVGAPAPLYAQPDLKSRQYKALSNCLIQMAEGSGSGNFDHRRWAEIELPPDYQNALKVRWGYIERRHLRQQLDYRLELVKQKGRWRVATFVGGD